MRLDKFLAKCGYGSRKEVRGILKDGLVKVDNIIVKDNTCHINPYMQTVEVGSCLVEYKEFVYIMLNKPAGVVSATADNKFNTVTDLVAGEFGHYNLFPAGRLDRDSEGLVLLTNDGKFSHNITAPSKRVAKLYSVYIDKPVGEQEMNAFRNGVTLDDGYVTLPAMIEYCQDDNIDNSDNNNKVNDNNYQVTIYEGKYHQVKRMFQAVGRKVLKLKRLKIGELTLDSNLEPGEYRELTYSELNSII